MIQSGKISSCLLILHQRPTWKTFPGANTLAYLATAVVTEKRTITLTTSVFVVKLSVTDVEENLAIAVVHAMPYHLSQLFVSDNGANLSGPFVNHLHDKPQRL